MKFDYNFVTVNITNFMGWSKGYYLSSSNMEGELQTWYKIRVMSHFEQGEVQPFPSTMLLSDVSVQSSHV